MHKHKVNMNSSCETHSCIREYIFYESQYAIKLFLCVFESIYSFVRNILAARS